MILFVSNEGRLANKLWMAVKLLVVHLEFGVPVLYPSFDTYAECFERTKKDQDQLLIGGENFNRYLRKLSKLLYTVYSHTPLYKRGIADFVYIDDFCRKKVRHIEIINGWLKLADTGLFEKYKRDIKSFFKPCLQYCSKSEEIISSAHRHSNIVIGVHLRKTDYSEWKGGLYHYPDSYYTDYFEQLLNLFPSENVCFLLCSDEPINESHFKSYNFMIGPGHFIEDLYALSLCDYIIGPPSTYSAWASFYGEVPLYHLTPNQSKINTTDFSVVTG